MALGAMVKRVHCVGIGGIGVRAIAEALLVKGYYVTGSDQKLGPGISHLVSLGVQCYEGHSAEHVKGADLVIYSSAISSQNPEIINAKKLGIPCVTRGQVLADLFNSSKGIAVVGSHGKTTTTSIISHVLIQAGLDPTCMIGGVVDGYVSPFVSGQGEYMVAEGDESDCSFLSLQPYVAIVSNIDRDHLNNYDGSYEKLLDAFVQFLNSLPSDGIAILNIDDPGICCILPKLQCSLLTFGVSDKADVRLLGYELNGMNSMFSVQSLYGKMEYELSLPGRHNIMNALASCALTQFLALKIEMLYSALATFPGVGRRFQCRARIALDEGEVLLIEDYGHHPRAIEAVIHAARDAWPHGRLVMVFQPHRYSRTKDCLLEFVEVLSRVDCLVLLDVYSAGEDCEEGVQSIELYQRLENNSLLEVYYVECLSRLPALLSTIVRSDDIILLQGAGDIGSQASFIEGQLSSGVK